MSDVQKATTEAASPLAAFAAAQRNMATICRAWTEAALGAMSAGTTEADGTKALFAKTATEWHNMVPAGPQQAAMHKWLETAHAQFEAAIQIQRKANDAFVATLFKSAEILLQRHPAAEAEKPALAAGAEAASAPGESAAKEIVTTPPATSKAIKAA